MILAATLGITVHVGEMPKELTGYKITIDPGHPSENGVGTKGKTLKEVNVCWEIAQRTATVLKEKGAMVKLTKKRLDEMVTNQKRAEIGNAFGSDLVIRLHCDAANERGFATYYPSVAGTVRGVSGPSKAVIDMSKKYASVFHSSLAKGLKGEVRNRGLKTEASTYVGSKQGALTGSIFSKRPVLLVEMAVLTQKEDEAWMSKEGNRSLYAKALGSAIADVFKKYPK